MNGFRPLENRTVRWRPEEGEGLEHATLSRAGDAIVIRSVVIGERDASPYGVRYVIQCDPQWRMRSLDLESSEGRSVRLTTDGNGHWRDAEGRALPQFDGCAEVDLAGTPFTNTLPIRRAGLTPKDGTAEFSMVFVPFDSFEPFVDRQFYTCLEQDRLYRFENDDRSFTADLPVDEDGLVMNYPSLFERIV